MSQLRAWMVLNHSDALHYINYSRELELMLFDAAENGFHGQF